MLLCCCCVVVVLLCCVVVLVCCCVLLMLMLLCCCRCVVVLLLCCCVVVLLCCVVVCCCVDVVVFFCAFCTHMHVCGPPISEGTPQVFRHAISDYSGSDLLLHLFRGFAPDGHATAGLPPMFLPRVVFGRLSRMCNASAHPYERCH